jgi:hypothetical protein
MPLIAGFGVLIHTKSRRTSFINKMKRVSDSKLSDARFLNVS